MNNLVKYTGMSMMALLLCIVIVQCEGWRGDNKRNRQNLSIMADSMKTYKNRLGTMSATIGTLQLENNEMQDLFIEKDAELAQLAKEFSKVKSVVKFSSDIEIKDIGVKFDEPIVLHPCDSVPVTFERSGEIAAEWYNLKYRVTNDSLQIPKLSMHTETVVMTGIKRKWFLGAATITTDVTNTNPYITVTDLKSAEVVVPSPWYKKWYVWGAAGLVTGLILK